MGNTLFSISERLKADITKAGQGLQSCVFSPECILYNSNSGFKFKCRYVKSLVIMQDFVNAYCDTFQLAIDVTKPELENILANMAGLHAAIILTPQNVFALCDAYNQKILTYDLLALVNNQEDPNKKFNPNSFGDAQGNALSPGQNEAMTTYTLTLIEPEAYTLRHRQINAILGQATVGDAIYWSASAMGISDVKMSAPDNQMSYEQLIIPPGHNFSNLYPFLQERYGVYAKGLGYYYTSGCLYVYPRSDKDPSTAAVDGIAHIVNAPPNSVLGSDRYHAIMGKDLYIVSPTQISLEPKNTAGAENSGNVHVSTNPEQLKDGWATLQSDGRLMKKEGGMTAITTQNSAMNMMPGMINLAFKGERSNIFQSTSDMSAFTGTTLSLGWPQAYPRLLRPGHSIYFHYDAANRDYKCQKGRLDAITYASSLKASHDGDRPWIVFTAQLSITLESEVNTQNFFQSVFNW